jgi:murein DD-endopeptidase MepM/ murein hydrolase activator NlpD
MHCSKMLVSAGEHVEKGEQIAKVGSTGTATGPHLHFEIRLYGEPMNPTTMIMQ